MSVVPLNGSGRAGASWKLPTVDTAEWIGQEPPVRRFIVDGWLARGTAALLVGEDGIGKSLLAQQLATCVASGRPFLGMPVEQAGALYLTCEDDENELWRRQRAINRAVHVPSDAAPAMLSSLVGIEAGDLGWFEPTTGRFVFLELGKAIVDAALSINAGLIVLDNLAHLFPGNENVRREVALFCSALERIAIEANATVLMLAHPSKGGAEYSGSTGWSAHVRQRWFLEKGDDGLADRDVRVLRKSKANYSIAGEEVRFRWHEWAFVQDGELPEGIFAGMAQAAQAAAENEAFLRCLDAATQRRQCVSHNQGVNYAPTIFAAMTEGKGFKKEAYQRAFERLLHLKVIELDRPVFQRDNRVWKFGIKRAERCTDPHTRGNALTPHQPRTDPHQPHAQTGGNPCTDPHRPECTDPLAPTPRTNPHRPPFENGRNPCTDPHAPTPLHTTYVSGAAAPAAPDQDDVLWDFPA